MITAINEKVIEFRGLSTDTKPVDDPKIGKIGNGSIFFEMDTGKAYMFNQEANTWIELTGNYIISF